MRQKLALKILTASDLTLFKWHFENRPAGNQKALNLNRDVLAGALYPHLGAPPDIPNQRYPIDLYLLGPGVAPPHNLQRKILRQQKNWRLNGELISNPEEDKDRYNVLREGDFAVLSFMGDAVPSSVTIVLIAKNHDQDAAIHTELLRMYPQGSMRVLKEEEMAAILRTASAPVTHPLYDFTGSDSIEDAILGGTSGLDEVNRRRAGRGIRPEEFLRLRKAAEQTGNTGEEIINDFFLREVEQRHVEGFEWVSSVNAIAPFDFLMTEPSGESRMLDVKSTAGAFSNPIHLSLAEMRMAVAGSAPYDIYRVYEISEEFAKLRIARNVGAALHGALASLQNLPAGMSVDSVSVQPGILAFGDEVLIDRAAE
jgi:hypothetical protein